MIQVSVIVQLREVSPGGALGRCCVGTKIRLAENALLIEEAVKRDSQGALLVALARRQEHLDEIAEIARNQHKLFPTPTR